MGQIGNGRTGTYNERLASTLVHELVHVGHFEAGKHPCSTVESHAFGDEFYELAWQMYEDIFGLPAPDDPDYATSLIGWDSRRPACLR